MILLFLNFEAQIKSEQNPDDAFLTLSQAKIPPGCLPLITMAFLMICGVSPALHFSDFISLEENNILSRTVWFFCNWMLSSFYLAPFWLPLAWRQLAKEYVGLKSSHIHCYPSDSLIHPESISEMIILKQPKAYGHVESPLKSSVS